MEDEKEMMTATDDNKTYVASFSLDERLEKTEKMIEDLQNTIKRDRTYRSIVWIILGIVVLVGLMIAYVKWDAVMMIFKSLLGVLK